MSRGKKRESDDLVAQLAQAKLEAKKRIKEIEDAERKAIEEIKRQIAEKERARREAAAELAEPILKPAPVPAKLSPEDFDKLAREALKSLAMYGTAVPPKEASYATMNAVCPNCGKEGKLATEFGFKSIKNAAGEEKIRPQSWCRECRNGSASHPGRSRRRSA